MSNIDLENDELLFLAKACRLLPRKPSPATLWRWRTKGVEIKGQRIRLECIRVGGVWCTTQRAFSDFLRRQTEAALGTNEESEKTNEESEKEPIGRSKATKRKLKHAGLL